MRVQLKGDQIILIFKVGTRWNLINAESQQGPRNVPPRMRIPAASCVSLTPCAGKTSPPYFFGFRVVFAQEIGAKRLISGGFLAHARPLLYARAHQVFWCRSGTGERSHSIAHGAVVGCTRDRFPDCFDVWYQCFRIQKTLFLFMSFQISFVTANINKL